MDNSPQDQSSHDNNESYAKSVEDQNDHSGIQAQTSFVQLCPPTPVTFCESNAKILALIRDSKRVCLYR